MPKDRKYVLDYKNKKFLCEFGFKSYRFYYELFNEIVEIKNVRYLGEVSVDYAKKHKSGSFGKWNRQRDFINWIKKKFKN